MDKDINDYFFTLFPTTPTSKVAFAEGYTELFEVAKNDFGEAKYSRITFSQNKTLIAAFAIALIIAGVGGLFTI